MELELKEERLAAATRELEERGGGGDELAALRRQRTDLERRVRDQEEELDDLAGQIQVLGLGSGGTDTVLGLVSGESETDTVTGLNDSVGQILGCKRRQQG